MHPGDGPFPPPPPPPPEGAAPHPPQLERFRAEMSRLGSHPDKDTILRATTIAKQHSQDLGRDIVELLRTRVLSVSGAACVVMVGGCLLRWWSVSVYCQFTAWWRADPLQSSGSFGLIKRITSLHGGCGMEDAIRPLDSDACMHVMLTIKHTEDATAEAHAYGVSLVFFLCLGANPEECRSID